LTCRRSGSFGTTLITLLRHALSLRRATANDC
jgi:hypothetical protein